MASITFTDGLGFARLANDKPQQASRFSNWIPLPNGEPIGDTATRLSDEALMVMETSKRYGASFELRNIRVRETIDEPNYLVSPDDPTNAAWDKSNLTPASGVTNPSGGLDAWQLTADATNAALSQDVLNWPSHFARLFVRLREVTGGGPGSVAAIQDVTGSANVAGIANVNFSTGAFAAVSPNQSVTTTALPGGWWEYVIDTAFPLGHTLRVRLGWDSTASAGQRYGLYTPRMYAGVRRVDVASRLIAHLKRGGTCSVDTGDLEGNVYPTCGLMPDTTPSLVQTDAGMLEHTLSLSLINLAGSPSAMKCHYV